MGSYSIFEMFENPRRGRQARNLTTNVPKILDLKSSSEQKFSKNCRWVLEYLCMFSLSFTASRAAPFPWYSAGGRKKTVLFPAHYQGKEASLTAGNLFRFPEEPNNSPKGYTSQ